ncbi:bile acid:sodium symporter [Porphyromonadaceae bacterium OttesenSCG-928-L07]|nr:bile acid:sodium symporter [Porphyromonadaceae bacterium OttesenSCG-928-L07]MDL2251668.1 bile acid:sodium symporter [Odoribacter sp. OttesenSCG-928-J03]
MNTIFIVLPILTLLMFQLGIELNIKDFQLFVKRPKPVIIGLIGQLILLPLLAFGWAYLFQLEAVFFIGLILIACSPGGSSSNIFSMLAKGDIALSVSLTALSSVLTLFTIPVIMAIAVNITDGFSAGIIQLPIGSLIIQNILLMLLPILLGLLFKYKFPTQAEKTRKFIGKIAFPALLLLISVFFFQHYETILQYIGQLGGVVLLLILSALLGGYLLALVSRLKEKEKRTIIIEIGMQNAAQAIAIASSPFIFNNDIIAIPAIIYALLMNVVLLVYVRGKGKVINT